MDHTRAAGFSASAQARTRTLRVAFWAFFVSVSITLLVPAAWFEVEWFGVLQEDLDIAPPWLAADKVVHLLAFAVLGVLGLLAHATPFARVRGMGLLGALLLYGALVEVLQTLVPGRAAEWWDLGADAAGLVLAAMLWRLIPRSRLV